MLSAAALPSGPRGRALALGITFVMLGLLWVLVVAPLIDLYDGQAEMLAERQRLAGRMAMVAASAPAVEQQVAAAERTNNTAPASALLAGATDSLAGAALQEQMQAMARVAGATLGSVEMLPTAQSGEYRRIALRLATTAPWPVLVQLLAAIDRATPRMLVDDLRLSGTMLPAEQGAPPLDASLTVVAFRAAGSATKP